MTKLDYTKKSLNEAIEFGNKNKNLLPRVKNWCKHIIVEDVSRGLVAEIYKLPINLRISCPNTTTCFEAMNLEWIASDFIIGNCILCEFHEEIFKENFGNDSIINHQNRLAELREKEDEEQEKKLALKKEVNILVAKEKSKAEITQLSILNIVQQLEEEVDLINLSLKVVEASKLSPQFFSPVSIDFLSLFFDNAEFGANILSAVEIIVHTTNNLSPFAFDRLISSIEKNKNIDKCIGILRLVNDIEQRINLNELIDLIVDTLWYKRNIRDSFDDQPTYPNSILFLKEFYEKDKNYLFNLLEKQLKIDDKTKRININYFLQELIFIKPEIITPHIFTIIKSLELEDDGYEESADRITCLTLTKLYEFSPQMVMAEVNKYYKTLTLGAKISFLNFYKNILTNDELVLKSLENTNTIIEQLIKYLLAKETSIELTQEILLLLKDISSKKSEILIIHLDNFIGYYIEIIKAFEKYKWYVDELKKPIELISTFNPLIGKNYLEIQSEELDHQKKINQTDRIIQNLIQDNNGTNRYISIIKTISNLDSSKDGLLKSKLIAILQKSVNSPINLADLLPYIHRFLLDTDSTQVRYEGIDFVSSLIEKNEHLVTQNLIDLMKIFIKDSDIGIRAKSLEAYGSLIKKFPQYIENDEIELIIQAVVDKYIVIHKRAARLCYKIFPFLSEAQKQTLIVNVLSQEDYYYKEKEFDYCKELINILLFLTKEYPNIYSQIVKINIVRCCNSKDYYTDVDFIEKLTRIREQSSEFDDIWFKNTIGFLSRTLADHYNQFDSRDDLFMTIYKISKDVITRNIDPLFELTKQKMKENEFSDVIKLYSILGFFNLHELLNELTQHFSLTIKQNKSNEFINQTNAIFGRISNLEMSVSK